MGEGLDELRSAVETLRVRVRCLEDRVAVLEARPRSRQASADGAPVEETAAPHVPALPQGGLALAGRTLLVLSGAYLVRAVTDAGALPALAGVGLGLAYAAFWQLRADRDGRAGQRTSAALHGLATSAIAFPLIWETTVRFGLLGDRAAGAAVFGFAVLGLAVAWRHGLAANAWLTTLAACATVVAVLVSRHDPVTALVTLLALAAALEWLAFHDAWLGLRWCVAATLDVVAVLLVAIGARPEPPESYAGLVGAEAAAALLALPALYVTSVAARTLRRGCPVKLFEAVQGTLAAILGFEGARRVLAAHGHASELPALLAVSLGALCYAVAFAHAERRPGQGRNFYFYSTAGGLLMLGGTLELGLGATLPLVWTGLGLAAVSLGRRFDRTTLRTHGALYLLAAALGAGLCSAGTRALAGLPAVEPARIAWGVALGAAVAWAVLAGERDLGVPVGGRLPRLLLALVVVLALAEAARGMLGATLGSWLAADTGAQAVAGSAVLVALVLGLAWLAQRGLGELVWLVYPLVAVGALKLLLQDVRAGRPATLVASLGLYGSLLILLPRLLKVRERAG
jgi:hypothetical protein